MRAKLWQVRQEQEEGDPSVAGVAVGILLVENVHAPSGRFPVLWPRVI